MSSVRGVLIGHEPWMFIAKLQIFFFFPQITSVLFMHAVLISEIIQSCDSFTA